MKKFLQILGILFLAGLFVGGFRTFGPDIYFEGLAHNGDSPALVLSGDKVYQQDNIGAYAYLTGVPTLTTNDNAWHTVSGTFINEVVQGFISSGDMIVYQGHQRRIRYVMSWYGTTDTTATVMAIGVKHNGNVLTGSVVGGRLANVSDYISVLSISQALMNSGDTIQLVIRSDKNANLTPEMVVTYASPLF